MIKLKNILKESKVSYLVTEAFKSSILRKMTNNFTGLDKDFFSFTAKYGVEWNKISDATFSPIEEVILHMFSKSTEVNETMIELMTSFGSELLNTLEQFTGRWTQLSDSITTSLVYGNEVVFSLGILGDNDPTFALNAYVADNHPNAIATITHDDRGNGYCLFRLNDSPKIDFSKIESDERILFAHKNGFVAKTHDKLESTEILELLEKSSK